MKALMMMKCGHAVAVATTKVRDASGRWEHGPMPDPVCAICAPRPEASIVAEAVDLTGRKARCGLDHGETDSSLALAFFEYRGEGSRAATDRCGNCGYAEEAHRRKAEGGEPHLSVCDEFVPHGPFEFDLYYCGHAGWD